MRILVITKVFPAVSETFVRLHVESLLKLGHDVTVMAAPGKLNRSNGKSVDESLMLRHLKPGILPRGGVIKKFLTTLRQIPRERRSLKLARVVVEDFLRGRRAGTTTAAIPYAAALQDQQHWDIVHVHFGNDALPTAQLYDAGFLNAPLIVTFHGSDLNTIRKLPNREIYKRVIRTASLSTVGTRFMAQRLLECGADARRIRIVPMGVDLSMFPPHSSKTDRRAFPRLSSVGRLVEVKGIVHAIQAVARLKESWPSVSLDIVGDGPLRDELERLACRLKVQDNISFHGPQTHTDTLRILSESDIYVYPGVVASDGSVEGQGLALAEAQAIGLPVVASRVGGIPEVVVENESAFLVEPGKPDEIARRIAVLASDEELRKRMGSAGRRFVETHFDQKELMRKWLDIYLEVTT